MKAYFWKPDRDSDSCVAVIADNSKEAKELGASYWGSDVGHDSHDWYIEQRVNLIKKKEIDIKGLSKGAVVGKEGLRRGLYSWIEEECDICKLHKTLSQFIIATGQCICSDCDEKINS